MHDTPPARPTFERVARHRRWRFAVIAFAMALLAGILAVPRDSGALEVFSEDGWSTEVTPSVDVVRRGDEIAFVISVSAATARTGLVDIEVNDPAGAKVFQDYWDATSFAPNQTVTFQTAWQVPDHEPLGEHVVRLGVFRVGWGVLYHWHHIAATFDVVRAGTPVGTTTTTAVPAPTTTVAATTTTQPTTTTTRPTTTTAPPTTAPPTTAPPTTAPPTTAPPTTAAPPTVPPTAPPTVPPTTPPTVPPSGSQFTARFETAADFYSRFVTHVGNACTSDQRCRPENISDSIKEWSGDHSMACAGPDTPRPVHVANHAEMFWHCAPGDDPAKGHVMTSLNTTGYAIVSFSPNQTFRNVRSICWDINMTDLGGGKWTNVIVVPETEYLRHPNPNPTRIAEGEGPFRMDYTTPGFNDEGSVGDFSLQTGDLLPGGEPWGLKNFRGALTLFRGEDILWERGSAVTTTDKAARYEHCIVENSNGTVTITRNALGRAESFTVNATIPDGPVRVIFQDDNYDPPKRDGYNANNNTWHWDNIRIS